MSEHDIEREATKPVRIRESLHTALRLKAAREGKKLGALVEEIVGPVVLPSPVEIHSFNSEPQPV